MRCQFLGNGVIVCGGRGRTKPCSTPGCRGRADLACDHPIERARDKEPAPRRGDSRFHRAHRLLFFVWLVEGDRISISQKDPNGSLNAGRVQVVTLEEWLTKAAATCDRPVCSSCSTRVGSMDFCGAHGRALKEKSA